VLNKVKGKGRETIAVEPLSPLGVTLGAMFLAASNLGMEMEDHNLRTEGTIRSAWRQVLDSGPGEEGDAMTAERLYWEGRLRMVDPYSVGLVRKAIPWLT